jgi:hypothetical protein
MLRKKMKKSLKKQDLLDQWMWLDVYRKAYSQRDFENNSKKIDKKLMKEK